MTTPPPPDSFDDLPPHTGEPSDPPQASHKAGHDYVQVERHALTEMDKAVQGVKHTRSRATYVAWFIGLIIAILLLVFILMNQSTQKIDLIFVEVDLPVGVSLLIAAIGGALITLAITSARLFQLRRALKNVAKQAPSR
ncbi:MAG: lipopolysaccharide assembly protein LapA domain-containing protein [Gordonia sp. (in: high G+C Gram-positive bacteria)]